MMHGQRNIKFILRIKEQETRLTLQEHDDDDDLITNSVDDKLQYTASNLKSLSRF